MPSIFWRVEAVFTVTVAAKAVEYATEANAATNHTKRKKFRFLRFTSTLHGFSRIDYYNLHVLNCRKWAKITLIICLQNQ